jgi:hypothetical protein
MKGLFLQYLRETWSGYNKPRGQAHSCSAKPAKNTTGWRASSSQGKRTWSNAQDGGLARGCECDLPPKTLLARPPRRKHSEGADTTTQPPQRKKWRPPFTHSERGTTSMTRADQAHAALLSGSKAYSTRAKEQASRRSHTVQQPSTSHAAVVFAVMAHTTGAGHKEQNTLRPRRVVRVCAYPSW